MKLIDVNEALEKLCEYCCCGCFEHCEERCIEFRNISNLAAVDAAGVSYGRWVKGDELKNTDLVPKPYSIYCSSCKNEAYWDTDYGPQEFDYCPYCGAKMDLEE